VWDEGERQPLKKLAQWCHRFTPRAGVHEEEASETLLLDATNLAPLYGSEALFLEQVKQELQRLGLSGRGALASTIGASWGIAHFSLPPWSLVPVAETTIALATLSVAALRLPPELTETLRSLGVERVGDLLELPRDQLRSRFGPTLLTRIDQALGTMPETFVAVEPPPEFVVEQALEFPLFDRETIGQVVALLLERLARNLAARGVGALRIVCRFDCEGTPPVEFEAGWFQPTGSYRHLLEIIELEMERLRLPAPATAISIVALRHALIAERQGTLFDEERRLGASRPLATLIDRLVGRLGWQRVVRCRLQLEAQPELAYVEIPLINGLSRRRKNSQEGANRQTLGALDRPLYLLRRPTPLAVLAVAPDGPPVRFRRQREEHRVLRHAGPERIETGWWRGRSAWRDYYRVETAEGRRFWIFRRRQDGKWFLHGIFG
jgi:protein ImuB